MNKSMKPAPKPTALTPEEKAQQVARFFSQKRDTFASGIMFNLCRGCRDLVAFDAKEAAAKAVAGADALIEALYPIPQEGGADEAGRH